MHFRLDVVYKMGGRINGTLRYACEQWRQPFIVESIFCMRVYVQMHKIIYYFGPCALGRCTQIWKAVQDVSWECMI